MNVRIFQHWIKSGIYIVSFENAYKRMPASIYLYRWSCIGQYAQKSGYVLKFYCNCKVKIALWDTLFSRDNYVPLIAVPGMFNCICVQFHMICE